MGRHILGVSAYFHDSAAALVRDGRIVAAAQEERFSRVKGDARFPGSAIAYCLREGGLRARDVDDVVFYEKPLARFDRILETYRRAAPAGWVSARAALPLWARDRLDVSGDVAAALGDGFTGAISYATHHESHAASAFFPSPYASAAILTMDAVGEWATSSIGTGRGSRLELRREMRFPHSLGLLYSALTYYTGFRVNSGEYKLMGLAPYGTPRYVQTILDDLVCLYEDGSLRLNLEHFDFHRGATMTAPSFDRLFGGPPRQPETPITQRHMDVAASAQRLCELAVLRAARHARELTGERRLVMAGGVALNCVANGRVLREGPFDEVWVQPAAGDAGGAVGAALLQWHHVLGRQRAVTRPDGQRASLLGPSFPDRDIGLYLDAAGARYRHESDEDDLLDLVAGWLDQGRSVGWFHGRMEFGPRALGARSILADARSPTMQQTLNAKIKHRESFRPFAPCVLAENVHDVFEMPPGQESPYMLVVAQLHRERRREPSGEDAGRMAHPDLRVRVSVPRSDLPAITHVDHSARVQTVDEGRHGRFYRLLRRFRDRTGCPALVNTSFNVRGEPIVHTPDDAYRCFMNTDLDCLVLEDHVLLKEEQPAWTHPGDPPHRRRPGEGAR